MQIFRIADGRLPIWDGTGAALIGGRWNSPGTPVIYGAQSYACAMLEILAHSAVGRVPRTHQYLVAQVPTEVSRERWPTERLPQGWDQPESIEARAFGDAWLREARSALLFIPSVVAHLEWNVLVNPAHPDARQLVIAPPQPVVWDRRLFERPPRQ
ncbi:conserved hypothetical protein [Aromatoleum aromaticum EbN1]|uniref:RES domain-containing protein n=1 Tax=Aromatoleum aromaticum (strain DSM 19018 / LMG 30748 / EbN1) TaxID=76114 RepID=Q5NY96_AROAE|nr:RES family NAD+ phosphorylase [Aromatoleum aromaticum]CAI09968.1 conserved hypothetical protein [Aromatoleum aromaticum EbN1]